VTANIFGPDLGIVLVIILLVVVFGSQLPKLARNAGMAGKEFRKAQQEAEEDAERDRASKAAAAAAAPADAAGQPSAPAGPPPFPVLAAPDPEGSIRLTNSELAALLQAREAQVKREWASPGS
jgi:TatA/E family protein of Tat protein translocase